MCHTYCYVPLAYNNNSLINETNKMLNFTNSIRFYDFHQTLRVEFWYNLLLELGTVVRLGRFL